jgi:hypothetical protein
MELLQFICNLEDINFKSFLQERINSIWEKEIWVTIKSLLESYMEIF